jgi:hypothetical protein
MPAMTGTGQLAVVIRCGALSPGGGFVFGKVFDVCVGRVRFDCLYALLGSCFGLVSLAGSDDLAVWRLEVW